MGFKLVQFRQKSIIYQPPATPTHCNRTASVLHSSQFNRLRANRFKRLDLAQRTFNCDNRVKLAQPPISPRFDACAPFGADFLGVFGTMNPMQGEPQIRRSSQNTDCR